MRAVLQKSIVTVTPDLPGGDVGLPPPDDDESPALVVGPDVDDDAEPVSDLHAVRDGHLDVPDVPGKLESCH